MFAFRYASAGAEAFHRPLYYAAFTGLFLFSAFRFQVGCDWSGYYYQYWKAADINWSALASNREPIWWGLLGLVQRFGLPYPTINVVSSAIFFLGVHTLAKRQPDPFGFLILLLPILIINMPMSAIRQGAAIGVLCLAFNAFVDRRAIMFALWVVLAAGFHASALVFLLLLPLTTGAYTQLRVALAALLAIPGLVLLVTGGTGEAAIRGYLNDEREAFGAVFRLSILVLSAGYFFVFARRKWAHLFPRDYSLVSLGAIGMVLSALIIPVSSIMADRFGYYLIPIQVMIFARLPFLLFKHNQALHSSLPYIGLLLVFVVWTQNSWHFAQCYNPYATWLFGLPGGSMLR